MTPNKEKAIACLLAHKTKKEAAAAAGITDRTLRSYFDDPEFRRRYQDAFGDMVEDATRDAQRILSPAFSVLKEIMEDTDGNVDILVAGVGTGGTLTGIGETLRAANPDTVIWAVEPENAAIP